MVCKENVWKDRNLREILEKMGKLRDFVRKNA